MGGNGAVKGAHSPLDKSTMLLLILILILENLGDEIWRLWETSSWFFVNNDSEHQ